MKTEREMLVERLSTALSDYEYDNDYDLPNDLAGYLVDNGFLDNDYEEPVVPVISPATIKLLVGALNANTRTSLGRDCEALKAVRDSAARDGLIKRTSYWTCESCVDEPVEVPVAPVIPFVTKEV